MRRLLLIVSILVFCASLECRAPTPVCAQKAKPGNVSALVNWFYEAQRSRDVKETALRRLQIMNQCQAGNADACEASRILDGKF